MKIKSKLMIVALSIISNAPAFSDNHSYLPMDRVYQGPIQLPDFNGRDRLYANYKTKITNEMKTGPNFAGHYAIVTIGCGTSCNFAFVSDVATGQVYNFPYGGEQYYMLQKRYDVKSKFVLVHWMDNGTCYADDLTWNGTTFTSSGQRIINDKAKCD